MILSLAEPPSKPKQGEKASILSLLPLRSIVLEVRKLVGQMESAIFQREASAHHLKTNGSFEQSRKAGIMPNHSSPTKICTNLKSG